MTIRYLTGGKARRRGVELVEFALVLPVILVILMAIMEGGWLLRNQLTLSNAAREGVRYASLGNSSSAVITRIKTMAGGLNPALADNQITLEQTSDKSSTTPYYTAWPADTGTSPARNGVPVGNILRVTITYSNKPLTGFFPFLKNRPIVVSVSMLREAS